MENEAEEGKEKENAAQRIYKQIVERAKIG